MGGIKGSGVRVKGDERILGDSDFVLEVLKASEEEMRGLSKKTWMVPARSVFCYWAARELGLREKEFFL
jgi:hypothetical protein